MALKNYEGIILKKYTFSDNDEILHIFTKNSGKLKAIVKNSRTPSSYFSGKTEPFNELIFSMYGGKNIELCVQLEVLSYFQNIRKEPEFSLKAAYFLQLYDLAMPLSSPEPRAYLLLHRLLEKLNSGESSRLLLPNALSAFLRTIGSYPAILHCAICGEKQLPIGFDPAAGGMVCRNCVSATSYIDADLVKFMLDNAYLPLEQLKKRYGESDIWRAALKLYESYMLKFLDIQLNYDRYQIF